MDDQVRKKLEDFFSNFRNKNYKKGGILIEPEQAPSGVFYLRKGVIKMYAISESGEELTINTFKPISFFPMPWVINSSPNPYYFEAQTDVEVSIAPKQNFLEFIKQDKEVMFDLLSRIYKGLEGYMQKMESLMNGQAYQRLVTELVIVAKRFGQNSNGVIVKMTEKDLAAGSGLARETVSRELRVLKRKRLVDFRTHQLTIPNLQKLEDELDR